MSHARPRGHACEYLFMLFSFLFLFKWKNIFVKTFLQMYFRLLVHEALTLFDHFLLFLRSAPEALSASGLRGQPAPSPHHCVSVPEQSHHTLGLFVSPVLQHMTPLNPSTVSTPADPVGLVAQRWRPGQSVGDGGVFPRLASGPLQLAERGLGLGGRPERGRPRTEDRCSGHAQARLTESQRLPGSRRVSAVIQHDNVASLTPENKACQVMN